MANPYIATAPIFVGTALAHAVGDEVPDENVKANGWEDSVSRAGTKAADEATKPAETSEKPRQV
jgi:hypothetical protein